LSNFKDENSPTGRLKRYLQVSGTVGGLAAKLAASKALGSDLTQDKFALLLTETLGELRGPFIKVAQLLATVPDLLPPAYAEHLLTLQSQAPSMGWLFVKRRMRTELGPDWEHHFSFFEKEASFAASLGQVHKAQSLEGEPLACKLQYPDMNATIEADISQLRLLLNLYEKYDSSLSHKEMLTEIEDRLREELDYLLEAKRIKVYERIFQNNSVIHIPKVFPELSTSRLLTMSWQEGEKLTTAFEAPQETCNELAKNLFHGWYYPFYHYGVLHGDPHLGNYTFTPENHLNLLDFGCVRIFPPSFIQGVVDLYHSLLHGDEDLAVHAYKSWGFTHITRELIDVLNIWAQFLYEPLLDDKVRPIHASYSSKPAKEVASRVHQELKKIGGVKPPREFVFVDRAAIGLGSVFMHLKAQLNWYQLFNELIDNFSTSTLEFRQKQILDFSS
jgi:predicted unusual protein kinase regulating ubiquinone biosynthesis (AarF/ABC1/UbiB family)